VALEPVGDQVGVQRPSVRPGEHQVVVVGEFRDGAFLGLAPPVLAQCLQRRRIEREGAPSAYLTPVVAVVLGVAVVDERLSWNLAVGMAVVLVGVWIAERDLYERLTVASDTSASSEDGDAQVRERIR
jgi:hypothetical protein